MLNNKIAFTLVEMIVAMAVSAIIIAATYASYDIVKTQYKKNLDVAEMHQSGRGIMQMIERDIRMAGFNYIDKDAKTTYGPISKPLIIKDSGNKCCDEVTVIYDYVEDVLDWKGKLVSSSVNRIRIHYWTEAYTSKKGDRYRLYKQKDILGKSNAVLANPIIGNKEIMADYIEDLQFVNITTSGLLYGVGHGDNKIYTWDPTKPKDQEKVGTIDNNSYYINALAFGPSGLLYGVGRGDNKIYTWDPTKPKDQEKVGTIDNNSYYIDALAFGPSGLLYGVGRGDNKIYIWDPTKPKDQEKVGTIDNNSYYINALAFGPSGLLYGVGHGDNKIYIWDPTKPKDQEKVGTIDNNSYYINALAFGPSGLLYGAGRGDNKIYTWDPTKPKDQEKVGTIDNNSYYIDALAFGPSGLLYGVGHGDNKIYIWDPTKPKDQEKVGTIDNNSYYINALAYKTSRTGQESLVTINLTLRAKNEYGKLRQFTKKDYHGGNYKLDKTDRYKRDTFSSAVLARNLML